MENYGHMAVEYGEKIFFHIGSTNKFYWQIFLSIMYSENHLFLTNVIVLALNIYITLSRVLYVLF